ncbi:MAG TPA: hypothetical protein VF002_10120 [Gaiellaceae bacterium]
MRALARLGRELLTAEGRSVSDALVERIAKTLEAAALDTGSRFLLRAGVLSEELEPPGFEALAGLTPPPKARAPGARAGAEGDETAPARRAVQAAREEVRERARETTEAEREAKRAESAAASARRRASRAQKRQEASEQALAEAEAALRKARRRR